jgi:hypothetical protein
VYLVVLGEWLLSSGEAAKRKKNNKRSDEGAQRKARSASIFSDCILWSLVYAVIYALI